VEEAEILARLKDYVRAHGGPAGDGATSAVRASAQAQLDLPRLDSAVANAWSAKERVAQLNPRNPGALNDAVQGFKKAIKRLLGWYTRSFHDFHSTVVYALQEEAGAIRALDASVRNLERDISGLRSETMTSAPAPQEAHADAERYVKEQRRSYVELFRDASDVADLNCGRGELLQLLREHGIRAYGVSPARNAGDIARRKAVKIVIADIFEHLKGLPERSLGGAFSAGFVEHLPPRLQAEFLQLLSSRLRPGAVTVIETVSPASAYAPDNTSGTIAPDLLESLLEVHSFRDIRVFSLAAVECHLTSELNGANKRSRPAGVLEPDGRYSPTSIYSVVAYRS